MNLIDADKLLKQLDDDIKITSEFAKKSIKYDDYRDFDKSFDILYMLKSYRAIVEGMPTAFDVDKVVKHIEECNRIREKDMEKKIDRELRIYYEGQLFIANEIIKLIKGGGIDD